MIGAPAQRLRKVALLVSVSLVAVFLPVLLSGSAQAATAFSTTVVNQSNGNCVDVPGATGADGAQLIQWPCNSGANQLLTFTPVSGSADTYTIGTVTAGKCVDVFGASNVDNARIVQWACHDQNNQRFRLQPVSIGGAASTFNLVSVASGKCIAPAGDASAGNTGLVQPACAARAGAAT